MPSTADLPVAVDAMGGDNAPDAIVAGARIAFEEFGVPVILVGRPDEMGDVGDIPVHPASEVIGMDAEPASSVRRMKDASIVRAAELVRDGQACSVLSAGNTGAAMAASLLRLGRIKGIPRPAIAVPFPVLGSTPSTLLDCGANADCQPEWLVQFAQMGTIYARSRFELARPRVGIMTIGEEAGKGNTLVKDAATLLETTDWASVVDAEFIGNVEGRDVMSGAADVIVCDGFTGNIILKSVEGAVALTIEATKQQLRSLPDSDELAEVVEPALAPLFHELDPNTRGSAMLLGTKEVSMIAHGSSDASTIANAIRTSRDIVGLNMIQQMRDMVAAGK